MSTPSYSDFIYYTVAPLKDTDWQFNFHKVIDFLTDGTADVTVNSLTTASGITSNSLTTASGITSGGNIGVAGNITASGIMTAASFVGPFMSGNFIIGSFTHDMSTASGTQVISGLGFQPSLLFFVASRTASSAISFGTDNGTTHYVTANPIAGSANYALTPNYSIYYDDFTGGTCSGKITALGADGFTLTWARSGSITGTANIMYLAFR